MKRQNRCECIITVWRQAAPAQAERERKKKKEVLGLMGLAARDDTADLEKCGNNLVLFFWHLIFWNLFPFFPLFLLSRLDFYLSPLFISTLYISPLLSVCLGPFLGFCGVPDSLRLDYPYVPKYLRRLCPPCSRCCHEALLGPLRYVATLRCLSSDDDDGIGIGSWV